MAADPHWIALIRAIGGATHARLSMSRLREASLAAGLGDVRTVLATGNLIFASARPEADLHQTLTAIIAAHGLGPAQEVFLRRPDELRTAVSQNPYPAAAQNRPSRLLIHALKHPPQPDNIKAVQAWPGPELCQVVGREVFIDYQDGIGTSKLTPKMLDRLLGQTGTARNWNTMARLIASLPPAA